MPCVYLSMSPHTQGNCVMFFESAQCSPSHRLQKIKLATFMTSPPTLVLQGVIFLSELSKLIRKAQILQEHSNADGKSLFTLHSD